ncbi:hypothetical protein NFI96_005014 [Prochilodus magdalenae]|nr:hypothetical protein NFI96_005014 [Prochilodus magdalenae]
MGDAVELRKYGYTLGISLGEGSYAKVKSAYSELLKTNVAVKIINRNTAPQDFLDKFLPRELDILVALNHSNIVRTFEIFQVSQGKVYIVMELGVQGDLLDLIKTRGALPEDFSRKLFRQLSLAIQFMHNLGIAHRDLKCENLLLDKDFNLKVSDFGFSRRLEYKDSKMVLSRTFCGSAAYAAPEVLRGLPYDPKVYDVWSMGVVLFIMVCGSMPYDDSNIKKMLRIQMEHHVDFPRFTFIPMECKELIYRMLHPDVARRIEIHDIVEHPWLQGRSKASKPCNKCRSKEEPCTSKHSQENSEEPKTEASTLPTLTSCNRNRSKEEPRPSRQVRQNSEEPSTEVEPSTSKACNKTRSDHKHGQNSEEPKAESELEPSPKSTDSSGANPPSPTNSSSTEVADKH